VVIAGEGSDLQNGSIIWYNGDSTTPGILDDVIGRRLVEVRYIVHCFLPGARESTSLLNALESFWAFLLLQSVAWELRKSASQMRVSHEWLQAIASDLMVMDRAFCIYAAGCGGGTGIEALVPQTSFVFLAALFSSATLNAYQALTHFPFSAI
jgi:hypothetical protein